MIAMHFLQDADMSTINIQVCVYAFDLLYLNGKVSCNASIVVYFDMCVWCSLW